MKKLLILLLAFSMAVLLNACAAQSRAEGPETKEIPAVARYYHTFTAVGHGSDASACLVSSASELDSFYKANEAYFHQTIKAYDVSGSADLDPEKYHIVDHYCIKPDDLHAQYTDEWFSGHQLVIVSVYRSEGVASVLLNDDKLLFNGNQCKIDITRFDTPELSEDSWHIFIETERVFDKDTVFEVNIINKWAVDPQRAAQNVPFKANMLHVNLHHSGWRSSGLPDVYLVDSAGDVRSLQDRLQTDITDLFAGYESSWFDTHQLLAVPIIEYSTYGHQLHHEVVSVQSGDSDMVVIKCLYPAADDALDSWLALIEVDGKPFSKDAEIQVKYLEPYQQSISGVLLWHRDV